MTITEIEDFFRELCNDCTEVDEWKNCKRMAHCIDERIQTSKKLLKQNGNKYI